MFNLMPFGYGKRNDWLEDMDRSFDRLFRSFAVHQNMMSTDIEDKGDYYELKADMPGLKKEDIKITLDGDFLTIRAKHDEKKNKEEKNRDFVCRERVFREYQRCFNISDIVKEDIKASYDNGILQLNLPKKQANGNADNAIQIEID